MEADSQEGRFELELTGFNWKSTEKHSNSLGGKRDSMMRVGESMVLWKSAEETSEASLKEINSEPTRWGQTVEGLD